MTKTKIKPSDIIPKELISEKKECDGDLFLAATIIAAHFFAKAGLDQKEKIIIDAIALAKEIREKTRA